MKKARALQERAEVLMNEMPPDDDDDDEERAPRPKDEDIAGDVHTVDHPRKGAMGHRTGERCGGHAGPDDVMEGTVLGSLQANTPPPPLFGVKRVNWKSRCWDLMKRLLWQV